jgi:hypothetical protein
MSNSPNMPKNPMGLMYNNETYVRFDVARHRIEELENVLEALLFWLRGQVIEDKVAQQVIADAELILQGANEARKETK